MTGLLLALSIVGAVTVAVFIAYLIVRAVNRDKAGVATVLLRAAFAGGVLCAVLGVLVAFTGGN